MALTAIIFVATFGLLISFEGIFGCNYEIRGLGNTVSLTIDCRFQPLSYVILDRLTFSEVNAQILLARPSEYFDFRNDVLIRKQCLPVGLDERLEFFIPDVPGCFPTFMTVTVEPTVPAFSNYDPGPMIFVDTCISDQTETVAVLEIQNDLSCVRFNCTVESYNSQSHVFWVEDKSRRRRRRVIVNPTGSKHIITSVQGLAFNMTYYLGVACFDNSVAAPNVTSENTAIAFLNATFVRADSCTVPTTSTLAESTSITTLRTTEKSTTPLNATIVFCDSSTAQTTSTSSTSSKSTTPLTTTAVLSFSSSAQSVETTSTASTSTSSVTSSTANPVIVGQSTISSSCYSTDDNDGKFFNKPVNVAVISAVGGVVLIGLIILVLFVKFSSCSKVIPAGVCEPEDGKENRSGPP